MANPRLPVRMGLVGSRQKLLDHLADRIRVRPHAPFLAHYAGFLVELPQHGIQEAFALQVKPQFNRVRRQAEVVIRLVAMRGGVQPSAAGAVYQLAKLVGNHELPRAFLCRLEVLLQRCQLRLVGLIALVALGAQGKKSAVDTVERILLLQPVLRAHLLGALERHVLKHVSHARDPLHLLHRTDIGVGIKADHWSIVPLHDDEFHAVVEGEFRHLFLKFGKAVLGGRRQYQCKRRRDNHGESGGGPHGWMVLLIGSS
jgi:hypothetical protein